MPSKMVTRMAPVGARRGILAFKKDVMSSGGCLGI